MDNLDNNSGKFTHNINTQKYRMHVLGLAHVPTIPELTTCAYTQKIRKLCSMLKSEGNEVIFYGVEGSRVECDEFVQVLSEKERIEVYGNYDMKTQFFKHDGNDVAYVTFNQRAVTEIKKRAEQKDFLLITMGNYQKLVADGVAPMMAVEAGIGYEGVFTNRRVFESYAWMHYVYGLLKQGDGNYYDCVIPNYFDPLDFPFQKKKEDYFLYMGRIISRKGVEIAAQVSRELGKKLLVVGQGSLDNPVEGLKLSDYKNIEYHPAVYGEERAKIMGKAKLAFAPTYYIEPFGGVAVEMQFCGTPVLTTDFGVFSETVKHGVTGYRCHTFDDFCWSAEHIGNIKPSDCNEWAIKNYSMERVGGMYQEYFGKLYDLWGKGWYERHPERTQLDWLNRYD